MKAARQIIASQLIALLLCFSHSVSANSAKLDQAVESYYAGQPGQAIEILKPLAAAGNVEAQYLLGNIHYALSRAGKAESMADALIWYELAALQDSADANYALGVIYDNKRVKSQSPEDSMLAEDYYQKAFDLGHPGAEGPLIKLAAHNRAYHQYDSLSYTNDSFPRDEVIAEAAPAPAEKQTLSKSLAGFQATDDLLADAKRVQSLIDQINQGQDTEQWLNTSALTGLLSGFESTDKLISDLTRLWGHIQTATELSTAPGAN